MKAKNDLRPFLRAHLHGLHVQREAKQASVDDLLQEIASVDELIKATEKVIARLPPDGGSTASAVTLPTASGPRPSKKIAGEPKDKKIVINSSAHRIRTVAYIALREAGRSLSLEEIAEAIKAADVKITAKSPVKYVGRNLWKGEWFKFDKARKVWELTGEPMPGVDAPTNRGQPKL